MNLEKHSYLLIGAASPLVVDYEEALRRAEHELCAIVSLGGPVRALTRTRVLSLDACLAKFLSVPFLPVAFTPGRRMALHDMAKAAGLTLADSLIDPSAVVARSSRIGQGGFANALVSIGGASLLGTGVVVNRGATIGHHNVLSDFSSIGPGANLGGNVRVGEQTVIGIGATIYPDVKIGRLSVVAGGAVVRQDVDDEVLVAGNPARPMRLRPQRTTLWTTDQE